MRFLLLFLVTIVGICCGCGTRSQREFSAISDEERTIVESTTLSKREKLISLEKTAARRRELSAHFREDWERSHKGSESQSHL
jgi:hypothetical protein